MQSILHPTQSLQTVEMSEVLVTDEFFYQYSTLVFETEEIIVEYNDLSTWQSFSSQKKVYQ